MGDIQAQPALQTNSSDRIVFRAGQDNSGTLKVLEKKLKREASQYVDKAYSRHAPQKRSLLTAVRQFVSAENLITAIFPDRPLCAEDIPILQPKIKEADVPLDQMRQFGVLTSYDKVKDADDVYLYSGLYVLSAPEEEARSAVNHQENYKYLRPHVNESKLCHLPSGEQAYYTELGAIGFNVGIILFSDELEHGSHFHLQPTCTDAEGHVFNTDSIVEHMDGFKIYTPITVEKNGVQEERTLAFGTNITIWGGLPGAAMSLVSDSRKRKSYSMAGASEILVVLKQKAFSAKASAKK